MADLERMYMAFEDAMTAPANALRDEVGNEAARDLVLRVRIAAKKYWLDMKRPVPKGFKFPDPDAPPPKPRAKRGTT